MLCSIPTSLFLHTLALDRSHDRLLVASPGYDAIIELDLTTKKGDVAVVWMGSRF